MNKAGIVGCLLVLLTISSGEARRPAAKHPKRISATSLVGRWTCTSEPNNRWQMRVASGPSHTYRGYLSKQGVMSREVGFHLGELVWTAHPGKKPNTYLAKQKYRTGAHRVSNGSSWRSGALLYSKGTLTGPLQTLKRTK